MKACSSASTAALRFSLGEADEPPRVPARSGSASRPRASTAVDWKIAIRFHARGKPLEGVGWLGFDAAGVVDEVGEGVDRRRRRRRVFGLGRQAQAEYAVLDSWATQASVGRLGSRGRGRHRVSETAERAPAAAGVGPGRRLHRRWRRAASGPPPPDRPGPGHHGDRFRRRGQPGLPAVRSARSRCYTGEESPTGCAGCRMEGRRSLRCGWQDSDRGA